MTGQDCCHRCGQPVHLNEDLRRSLTGLIHTDRCPTEPLIAAACRWTARNRRTATARWCEMAQQVDQLTSLQRHHAVGIAAAAIAAVELDRAANQARRETPSIRRRGATDKIHARSRQAKRDLEQTVTLTGRTR